jgi:hypothetical protein
MLFNVILLIMHKKTDSSSKPEKESNLFLIQHKFVIIIKLYRSLLIYPYGGNIF